MLVSPNSLLGSTSLSFFPGASVALDFVNNRYRVGGGSRYTSSFSILSGLTVSRSSVGYAERSDGSLVSFASNVARITDKGLLVEEARTNVIPSSKVFSVAGGATLVGDTFAAPDGTATATRFLMDLGAAQDVLYSTAGNITGGQQYVGAVWVRGIQGQTVLVQAKRRTGATISASVTVTVTLTGAWQRVKDLVWTSAADNTTAGIVIQRSLTTTATQIDLWGGQLEQAAFSSSDIPTTSASATRAADAVSITGLPTLAAFTAVARQGAIPTAAGWASNFPRFFSLSDGGLANFFDVYRELLNSAQSAAQGSNAGASVSVASGVNSYGSVVVANRYNGTNFAISVNGSAAVVSGARTLPASLSQLWLGNRADGLRPSNAYLERLVIYPYAASDAQLQALTS